MIFLLAVIVVIACGAYLIYKNNEEKNMPKIEQDRLANNADALRKYKELFDDGVITKEEFETKKAELLK